MTKNLSVYYHIWSPGDSDLWKLMVDEQLKRIYRSDLPKNASIYCAINGPQANRIADYVSIYDWLNVLDVSLDESEYEGFTLKRAYEEAHFNPDLKENMNVYISDVSRNKAMIHDGKKWNIANADEIINTLFDKAIIFCEDRNEELFEKIQKNEKIKKKINKEMYVMNIMSNNEPYEYNEYKEPIDVDGNILDSNELKRGACLSGVAKEHIKHSLYNKKGIVVNK
jgi:hypothetical protein